MYEEIDRVGYGGWGGTGRRRGSGEPEELVEEAAGKKVSEYSSLQTTWRIVHEL